MPVARGKPDSEVEQNGEYTDGKKPDHPFQDLDNHLVNPFHDFEERALWFEDDNHGDADQ